MKYLETSFSREEQHVINKLRDCGYFVYGLRDGEGSHYTVEPKVIVNNIGFVVTTKPIQFHEEGSRQYITDTELTEIGEVDPMLGTVISRYRMDPEPWYNDPTIAKKNEETIKRVEKKLNKELEDGKITIDQLHDRVNDIFGIGKGSLYNEIFGERR